MFVAVLCVGIISDIFIILKLMLVNIPSSLYVAVIIIHSFSGIGDADGTALGDVEGTVLGDADGAALGDVDGAVLGDADGATLGDAEGAALGGADGAALGDAEGAALGDADGAALGDAEGAALGDGLGALSALKIAFIVTSLFGMVNIYSVLEIFKTLQYGLITTESVTYPSLGDVVTIIISPDLASCLPLPSPKFVATLFMPIFEPDAHI